MAERAPELEPLQPEQVLFGFRGRLSEVRDCFDGSDAGIIRLQWLVNADGRVGDTRIEQSTVEARAVQNCLTRVVADLNFPEQDARASASWTFVHGVTDAEAQDRARRKKRRTAPGNGVSVDPSSPGKLPVSEIESVAEHGFRLYAFCMREGLNRNTRLNGRVALRFTIDRDGQVKDVRDAGSDLGDPEVIDCVAEAFYAMRFPEPEGGDVHVRYALLLNESS